MKTHINKLHKLVLQISDLTAKESYNDLTEDDVDRLAEAHQMLEDIYEVLYDKVFVTLEDE